MLLPLWGAHLAVMPDFAPIVNEQFAKLIEVAPHCILYSIKVKSAASAVASMREVSLLAGCRYKL